ncbi:MFS transporter [Paenibacillus cremeus]|nr:MFS transporter [Paenibacillus cremeus]
MTIINRLHVDRDMNPRVALYLVSSSSLLSGFAQFSYNPILPQVQQELQTSLYWVNMTVTVFTVAMAMMQLVFGVIADRKGRRSVLLVGMCVFVLASFGAAIAHSVMTLILYRMLQGVGAAAIPVVTAAVIGDLFEGDQRTKAMGNYQLIMALSPAIGPLIGGIIGASFGYWGIFLFIAMAGLLMLSANFVWLKESKSTNQKSQGSPVKRFKAVLQERKSTAVMLIGGAQAFSSSIVMVFIPNIFHDHFALSPAITGLSFFLMSLSFMISVKMAEFLEQRWGIAKSFIFGCWMNVVSLILFSLLVASSPSIAIMLFCFYGVTYALAMPPAITILTGLFPEDRATAVAVYNVCRNIGMALGPLAGAMFYMTNSTFVLFGATALIYGVSVGFSSVTPDNVKRLQVRQ